MYILKQYAFRSKYWTRPNEKVPLMPKDDDKGLMILA